MELQGYFEFGKPMLKIKISSEKNEIPVLVDTGFNGELMLSTKIIKSLKLPCIGFTDYTTASGEKKPTSVYTGNVEWFGKDKEVAILSSDAGYCLLGMELLHYCRLTVERHKDLLSISE